MWILQNSKEILENLKSQNVTNINSIKTYDFSTRYTTIFHDKLKSRFCNTIDSCFYNKNGSHNFTYLVIGHLQNCFVQNHLDCVHKYSENDIKKMLAFLIDNIYVVFENLVFQQSVEISMGINCAPLLADLSLYSYEAHAEFIFMTCTWQKKKSLAVAFILTFRYIDD